MDSITFNLCPGTWHAYFRDKNTLAELKSRMVITAFKDIVWTFDVPAEIKNNKDAEFVVSRVS